MKILVRGWLRDHGSKTLSDEDLGDLKIENDVKTYPADRAIIQTRENVFENENYIRIIQRIVLFSV